MARAVITLGGIGTIAAVLLMGVFLLAVALPLFRSARILSQQTTPLSSSTARRVAALGSDETGSIGWVLDSTEEGDGLLTAFHTATGEKLTSRPLAGGGLAEATCLRIVPGQLLAAVGYADGSFRPARIGVESEFVDDAALPVGLELKPGEAREIDGSVLLHDESGRYAKLRLIAETTAEPSRELTARVIDIDITQLAAGPLVAALDATGGVRVETVSSRRNLMTDAVVTTRSGATLAPVEPEGEGASPALFVRLSELGDQLFVFTANGMARRYAIRSIESPQLMESFDAAPGDAGIAMVTRLYGGNALAVADTSGAVRILCHAGSSDARPRRIEDDGGQGVRPGATASRHHRHGGITAVAVVCCGRCDRNSSAPAIDPSVDAALRFGCRQRTAQESPRGAGGEPPGEGVAGRRWPRGCRLGLRCSLSGGFGRVAVWQGVVRNLSGGGACLGDDGA